MLQLRAGAGSHLHPPCCADAGVWYVPITPNLIGGVHNNDPLAQIICQHPADPRQTSQTSSKEAERLDIAVVRTPKDRVRMRSKQTVPEGLIRKAAPMQSVIGCAREVGMHANAAETGTVH